MTATMLSGFSAEALTTPGDELPVRRYAPVFVTCYDRLVIQRDVEETKAAPGSAITMPETYRRKTVTGRIISGGMSALDMLKAHGHRIGDRVMWAKFAGTLGQEGEIRTDVPFPYKTTDVCLLMVKDILANFTLAERLASGEQEIQMGTDGKHFIADLEGPSAREAARRYAEQQASLFPTTIEKE